MSQSIKKACPKCSGRLFVNGECLSCAGSNGIVSSKRPRGGSSLSDTEFVDMLGLGKISDLHKELS